MGRTEGGKDELGEKIEKSSPTFIIRGGGTGGLHLDKSSKTRERKKNSSSPPTAAAQAPGKLRTGC